MSFYVGKVGVDAGAETQSVQASCGTKTCISGGDISGTHLHDLDASLGTHIINVGVSSVAVHCVACGTISSVVHILVINIQTPSGLQRGETG